jgi:hypothetical protein
MVGNDHVGTAALGCPGELKKNSTLCHPERSGAIRFANCSAESKDPFRAGSARGSAGEFRLQLKNQWMHHT